MRGRSRGRGRSTTRLRGRVLAVALLLLGLGAADARAATVKATSSNWAGYAARRTGVAFRHVGGTWTVPAVDCSVGRESSSASWVGLGGYAASSRALEQLGTESDCGRDGTATYSAWFEVVPAAATTAKLTIRPGDVVSASAAVSGHLVTLKMVNRTRGTTATKVVRAATVDVSSAEWIVEAPALCSGSTTSDADCAQTTLANFGSTGFTAARAITRAGHGGSVLDLAWNAVAITLSPTAHGGAGWERGPGRLADAVSAASGGATPGALSAAGSAFTVDYGEVGAAG
jgi:hypothetical protein